MSAKFVVEHNSRFCAERERGWRNCLEREFATEAEALAGHQSSPWRQLPRRLVRVDSGAREVVRSVFCAGGAV